MPLTLWGSNSHTDLITLFMLKSKVKWQSASAFLTSTYCAEAELRFQGRPFSRIREGRQSPTGTFFYGFLPLILSVCICLFSKSFQPMPRVQQSLLPQGEWNIFRICSQWLCYYSPHTCQSPPYPRSSTQLEKLLRSLDGPYLLG